MMTDCFYSVFNPMISWIYWDPDPNVFTIPYLEHSLRWYGLLFALGFVGGFMLLVPMIKAKLACTRKDSKEEGKQLGTIAYSYVDTLLWFIVIGTIIGARLGHVFFYEWPRYSAHPAEIFKIWEGGLASHGGTLGAMLAIFFYTRFMKKSVPEISFMGLCDLLTIPAAFLCVCIRIGNFINQEIIGTSSILPWAVVFGHPADGTAPAPRHPVQLYEALAYACIFFILWRLWKAKSETLPAGFMTGLLFVLVFGTRFLIEFFKAPQSMMMDESIIQTGQLLSLPFILSGFGLMWLSSRFRM